MDSLRITDEASAAVATHPRVTLDDIKASISSMLYLNGAHAYDAASGIVAAVPSDRDALGHLTICILVMRNGFSVIGKAAPASPENYNAELGRQFAYEDAVRQLWPLMGYALRDRIDRDKHPEHYGLTPPATTAAPSQQPGL